MNEKQWKKLYGEYQESLEQAPETVREGYQEMEDAIERYICAVEEWTFRTAFKFGVDYAATTVTRKAV